MTALPSLLASLADGSVTVVDLTTPLSTRTPVLTLPEPFANTVPLSVTPVSNFDEAGPFWAWNDLHLGEHTGTHLDAPAHWVTGRAGNTVATIPPARLIGPAAVIDRTAQAEADPDYVLEVDDLLAWEEEHGRIPDNAWLLFRTGWQRFGDDAAAFVNADEEGPHTPGISPAAAKWLAEERPITGYGVETVGIDAGSAGAMDPAFPAHYYLLGADKYGLTSLRNLDRLPATGAIVVASPLPIVGGTGSPSRALALVPTA